MGACFSKPKSPATSTGPTRQSTVPVNRAGPSGSANQGTERQVKYFTCHTCYDGHIQADRVDFGCGHVSCKTCVEAAFSGHIRNGDLDRLRCAKAGCGAMAGTNLVRRMVSNIEFRTYSAAMLEGQQEATLLKRQSVGAPGSSSGNTALEISQERLRRYHSTVDRLVKERELQAIERHSQDSKTTVPAVSNEFKCSICLDTAPVSTGIHFGCGHIHCPQCILALFELKVKERAVHGLRCPEPACSVEADNGLIRRVLDEETFKKYDEILLSDVIAREIPETVLCPKVSCQKWVPALPEFGFCEDCNYHFCTNCNKAYHGMASCGITEEQSLAETKRLQAAQTAEERERISRELEAQRSLQAQDSDRLIKEVCKKCPNSGCRANIEKSEGCNHMHCIKCGTHFCWLCLAIVDMDDPKKHFNEPGSKCLLFYYPL